MTRTEMINNLLDSYTTREIRALAKRLGVDVNDDAWKYWFKRADEFSDDTGKPTIGKVFLLDPISDILFDPGGWHEEFNKLAEMESNNESWEKFLIKRHKLEVDNADG